MRAARAGHGAPAQGRRTWHSSEMALRVFACARGRTRSFHAVCVEKGMRGAGRACIGVWECVVPEGEEGPEGREESSEPRETRLQRNLFFRPEGGEPSFLDRKD